jgi:hypothetical protein
MGFGGRRTSSIPVEEDQMKIRSIVRLATVSLLVAGCAKAATNPGSGSASPDGIAHATGAGDLVLQVTTEGGFVAPSFYLTEVPQFSLFGDRSIFTGGVEPAIYPGAALPSINVQVVTEAGIQAILQAAIDAGLDDGADHTDLGSVGIADANTTVFIFHAGGVSHTVKVYALGMLHERPDGMSVEEFQAREALQDLLTDLSSLETWLPEGSVGSSEPFRGSGARLYVGDYRPDAQLTEPPKAWPLDPPLASFGSSTDVEQTRCGVESGQDWTQTLLPMAESANELTPWTSDGQRYGISFRPLLPNETGC